MRHHTSPLWYELTSTGGSKQVDITPNASVQSAKFLFSGVEPRTDDMRNYLTRLWLHMQFVVDTDAAGDAVNWDKLAKGLDSAEVVSPVLGQVYQRFNTQGATLMHIIDVISMGYHYPQGARTQIPANADADYTVDLFFVLPLALECLVDPMETAQWTGFFDNGTVEAFAAAETVFDGDYDGALMESVVIRAQAEVQPSDREFLGVPFQWKRREVAGGGTSPVLRSVGGETALNGINPGCGLAALLWLTNATGIGLGGPDGVDNITSFTATWRNQKNIQNLDPFFHSALNQQEKRSSPISNGAAAALSDSVQWPKSMASTNEGRPAADPEMMALPIVLPGRQLHTAKTQRILGDLQIDFTVSAAIVNAHEFMSLELLEFTPENVARLAQLGQFTGELARKSATGASGTPGNFRYTANEFI